MLSVVLISSLGAACGAPNENFGASVGAVDACWPLVSVAVFDAPNENLGASEALGVGLVSVPPNENIGGGFDSDGGAFASVAPNENVGAVDFSVLESSEVIFGAGLPSTSLDSNVSDFATGDVLDKSTFGNSANEITGLSVSDLCSAGLTLTISFGFSGTVSVSFGLGSSGTGFGFSTFFFGNSKNPSGNFGL